MKNIFVVLMVLVMGTSAFALECTAQKRMEYPIALALGGIRPTDRIGAIGNVDFMATIIAGDENNDLMVMQIGEGNGKFVRQVIEKYKPTGASYSLTYHVSQTEYYALRCK